MRSTELRGGLPAKLHAPGKPWHKTKVTLLGPADWPHAPAGHWRVRVRHYPMRAIYWRGRATTLPSQVTAAPTELRLLPTKLEGWT